MKSTLLILIIFQCLLPLNAQDAKVILSNMDKILFAPKDKSGTISIVTVDKSGNEKVREASMYQKGPDKKLYRYVKPESQAGIATLSLPGDEMWLYMPAFDKPKKISLLSRSQAFTGTDFSYEDMATTPYSERFTPTIQSTGKDEYILELIPISGKSKYSKIILQLNKTHFYPISMNYYNEQGKHFKVASYTYEKIGKYWNASEVVMKDMLKNHRTIIKLINIKFDQGISDDLFLVDKMKQ